MPPIVKYTLEQFQDIQNRGHYTIPDEMLETINKIAAVVGATTYAKMPTTTFRNTAPAATTKPPAWGNKKKQQQSREISEADWETIRNFKATEFEQKTGADAIINSIRLALNKLTNKTYDTIKEQIQGYLAELSSLSVSELASPPTGDSNNADVETCQQDNVARALDTILTIATTNRLYSINNKRLFEDQIQPFATLFMELGGKIDDIFAAYVESFKEIEVVNEKDYDKYCEMNKKNDKRKAIAQFIKFATCNSIDAAPLALDHVKHLLEKVLGLINIEGQTQIVDELAANATILYDASTFNDDAITENIEYFASCKAKNFKSLSSKTIFMFVDLQEL